MLNSPMLSIFQHFHAIPLRSPLISLRSKWRLTGFSRRFTPKNPVRLHKPFGQLPRWGAKNVLPLNLIALPARGRLCPSLFFFHISHMRVFALMLWGKRYSRIVIPSAAEGSFSFAVFLFLCGAVCMKHRFWGAQGAGCFPLAVPLTSFAFPRTKKISRFRSK